MIAPAEFLILAALALFVLFVAFRICTKAGFPGYYSVAAVIPGLNVALVLFLALARWPLEKEVESLRAGPLDSRA